MRLPGSGNQAWLTAEIGKLSPDVMCLQEIADQSRVNTFLAREGFVRAAFADSADGQDNVLIIKGDVEIRDLPDPVGFQHPAQAAFVSLRGFDAAVLTVHLSWTDKAKREKEKGLLRTAVAELLKVDPDVIVAGDFNTQQPDIDELARSCGLSVMTPINVTTAATTHAGSRYDWILISPDLESEEA